MLGKDGSAVAVTFSVADASKFSAANSAFSNLGGQMPGYPTDHETELRAQAALS